MSAGGAASSVPSRPSSAGAAPSGTLRLDERVWRTVLPGGPTVLSERLPGVRSVAAGVWFRQGSVHETPRQRGISHLLEHMVFKGTRRRSARDLTLEIERVGGAVDAYTSHEATAFEARVADRHLDLALDVLLDMTLHPLLRQRDLELEREVVLDELAGLEDSGEDLAFELHADLLYGGHPYGAPVIGTRDSVAALARQELVDLHRLRYTPSNAVVAAAGRVEHEELVEGIARRVEAGRGAPPEAPPPVEEPGRGFRRRCRPGGRQSHLVAGALTVPHGHPLRYAVVAVTTALGGGMSSRLFQRIREELGLAYSVYTFQAFYGSAGHAGAYVGTRAETVDRARRVLLEELEAVAERGLDAGELEETREQLRGSLLLALESPGARVHRLAGLTLYEEPYLSLDEVAERIDGIGHDEVREAAALFHPDRLAVLELAPAGGGGEG